MNQHSYNELIMRCEQYKDSIVHLRHNVFGVGLIINLTNNSIIIDFPQYGNKKFKFPKSINRFLFEVKEDLDLKEKSETENRTDNLSEEIYEEITGVVIDSPIDEESPKKHEAELRRQQRKQNSVQPVILPTNTDCVQNENTDIKYIYLMVRYPTSYKEYAYQTNDPTIKAGDTVIVPSSGYNGYEEKATIVSRVLYIKKGQSTPYPPDKTKMIIRKV